MTNEVMERKNNVSMSSIEEVLMKGDLAKLNPDQRVVYYNEVCRSLGLNPFTRPFEYITLSGKMTLYAKKDATEQLRKLHGISIISLESKILDDLYIVKATAKTANGRVDASTGAVMIGNLRGDAKANAIMRAECVPIEYEILTKEGFKNVLDLKDFEMVASMNHQTHKIEWSRLQAVSIYDDQEVTHYGNSAFEFEITQGHKWATESNNGVRDLKPFDEIKSSTYLILAGIDEEEKSVLSEKEAATLGWIVTDGTIKKYKGELYRASICQSKEENFEYIDWCTSEMKVSRGKTDNRDYGWKDQYWWYISKESTQSLFEKCGFTCTEDLEKIICHLGRKERESMLKAMMMADGDKRGNFGKGDLNVISAFQILCALTGHLTSKTKVREFERGTQPFYLCRKLSYNRVAFQNLAEGEKRKTSVWCPTTKDGTWICRSDKGQVFVTGNTKAKRRVTLSISGLGMMDEQETDTVPGAKFAHVDMETGEIKDSPYPQISTEIKTISNDQVEEILDIIDDDEEYKRELMLRLKKAFGVEHLNRLPENQFIAVINDVRRHNQEKMKEEMGK